MTDVARHEPGPYTWDDFIALDEDDLRELIDGELLEVEVPNDAGSCRVIQISSSRSSLRAASGTTAS